MKYEFQAKHIQYLSRITKIRYEYLTSKLNIKPDIEEADGTGRAHLYSLKNLLQIAVANNANKMGMSLRTVKKLLDDLESYKDEVEPELFEADKKSNLSIYCAYHGEFPIIYIRGKEFRYYADFDVKIKELQGELKTLEEKDHKEFEEHQNYAIAVLSDMAHVVEYFPPDSKALDIWLGVADCYITINFGSIKNGIISQLED